jgi:hypothetical protein
VGVNRHFRPRGYPSLEFAGEVHFQIAALSVLRCAALPVIFGRLRGRIRRLEWKLDHGEAGTSSTPSS